MELLMTGPEFSFLLVVVGALSLFGGALAWASWEDSRSSRKSRP